MDDLVPPYVTHPLGGPFGLGAVACALFGVTLLVMHVRWREPGVHLVGAAALLAAVFFAAESAGLVRRPTPAFGPLWVAVLFEVMAVLRACGVAQYIDPAGWHRRRALWVAIAPPVLLFGLGMAGVPVPRLVGNYLLAWTGLVMGLVVLHERRRQPGEGLGLVGLVMVVHPTALYLMPVVGIDLVYARYTLLPSLLAFYMTLLVVMLQRRRRALEAEVRRRRDAEAGLGRLHAALEHKVAERQAELAHMVAALESFNHNVSHDLRGPLGGMGAMARLAVRASEQGRDADVDRMTGQIARQARHAGSLLAALLELTRVGNAPLRTAPVDLAALAREVVDALRLQAPASQPLPAISVGTLPRVAGDEALLRAALTNLVGNACKFSAVQPQPQVEIASRELDGDTAVCVRDNGPGFDPEDAPRLFEPFQRLHPGFQGHGIGLSIVRRIVERHGGRVWAEGAPGRGACFWFTLPARATAPQAA